MEHIKHKAMTILFALSFIPAIAIILLSVYSAFTGHNNYDWFEPDKVAYVAYGAEGFADSVFYYGGYLTLYIPIIPICVFYQVLCLLIWKKANQKKRK